MGKLEEMMRGAGSFIGESMGAGRQGAPVHRATPPTSGGTPNRLKGVSRLTSGAEIPIDKIIPDPDQPREEFDETALEHLAESLRTRGQLQPIRVRWVEGQGSYVIVCGERRWRAAVRAELKTMACVIQEGEISQGELLALQLVENLIRDELKPIEQAKAYRSLMDLNGWSARQVARELAIDHTGVTRALALLELPSDVQDQVEQGTLPPATAYEVSKIEDPDQQREVAAEVAAAGLSRAETVERIREVVGKRPSGKSKVKGRGGAKKPELIKSKVVRLAGGKVTIDLRKAGDVASVLSLVEETAAALRREIGEKQGETAEAA